MKDWRKTLISPATSILKAVEVIDKSGLQIALVIDENRRLLGTVTDGDIRRHILEGSSLDEPVQKIMCPNPTCATLDDGREEIAAMMKLKGLHLLPIVDDKGCIIGLEVVDDLLQLAKKDNQVVLMVGGLGTRLHPLTLECPKPLVKVGRKSILETILENLVSYGFHRFYFAVNYKAEMIKQHFGNGSQWGVKIKYLQEDKKLGTAGALSLLPEVKSHPLLVMNGDILTKVNFHQLLKFHEEHQVLATICVKEYHLQVSYGVVKLNNSYFESIDEKPVHRFFINAGIYVLEPEVLKLIPENQSFDMPDLFNKLRNNGSQVAAFPIREYWLDVGHLKDIEQAENEYSDDL